VCSSLWCSPAGPVSGILLHNEEGFPMTERQQEAWSGVLLT
jgi:hypothetical protein